MLAMHGWLEVTGKAGLPAPRLTGAQAAWQAGTHQGAAL